MLAVSLSGRLTQAESLALWALRKLGGISRSHSPEKLASLAFRFQPSTISRLPFTFSTSQLINFLTCQLKKRGDINEWTFKMGRNKAQESGN